MSSETPKEVKGFTETLKQDAPPEHFSNPLKALWHAANGSWHKAHDLIMDDDSKEAAWVHAHLHRREGDQANANYWYGIAGKDPSKHPHEMEMNMIAYGLLMMGGR